VLGADRVAVHHVERDARQPAKEPARRRVVAGQAGRLADAGLAEDLRVVGDGDEVERPAESDRSLCDALVVVRLDAHRLALRETIGVARAVPRVLRARVER
jgi:hypothetical protein